MLTFLGKDVQRGRLVFTLQLAQCQDGWNNAVDVRFLQSLAKSGQDALRNAHFMQRKEARGQPADVQQLVVPPAPPQSSLEGCGAVV